MACASSSRRRSKSIREQRGEVVVRFADGTYAAGRGVIGADGIHSRTRASVLPDAPRPAYTGIINLGGVVQTDLPPTGDAMHMVFGRRAFFGYAVRPSGETYWFSNYAQKEEPARDAFTNVPADTMRDRLLALHRDDPPEVSRILRRAQRIHRRISHLRHPVAARLAARSRLPDWRCGARDRAACGTGRVTGARGRVRAGHVSARCARSGGGVPTRSSRCGGHASSRSSSSRAAPGGRRRRPDGWAERSAISCCPCSCARQPMPRASCTPIRFPRGKNPALCDSGYEIARATRGMTEQSRQNPFSRAVAAAPSCRETPGSGDRARTARNRAAL